MDLAWFPGRCHVARLFSFIIFYFFSIDLRHESCILMPIEGAVLALLHYGVALVASLSLCENWPLENKVPMRSPYAFYPGVVLR